ncbi:hypothetical protein ACF1GT_06470 [Streptomyces sp. NPDC014636]|uniref:hypothetical protein n=1 Tax=Streptomyces sp. NPDC014636 TaxID=3364876 RepID=UPI00370080B3
MSDRTSDPGDARRSAQRPADEVVPGDERMTPEDEWAPGDAAPGRRISREARPEERLPGERLPGERLPGEPGTGGDASRLPGSTGPGREGLTGDDRIPGNTPQPPPGPAGVPESGRSGGPDAGQWHGTEGLRPGTEDMGTGVDAGFTASHRTERAASAEEDRMPDNGLGEPAYGGTGRGEAGTTGHLGGDTSPTTPGGTVAPGTGTVGETGNGSSGTGAPLLAQEESERWERQLREVVGGFVDEPRVAVEQADRTLEEIAARFSEAVTQRRRTLRMSWEGTEGRGPGAETDTEQLRLALRDYRELAGRLLHG